MSQGRVDVLAPGALLSERERRVITRDVALAMLAAGLLLLALVWRHSAPASADVAGLLAAFASLLVAAPVFRNAWHSLRAPSLHGVTDRLIALAMLAAWSTGDMITAALLPVVMIFGHILEDRSVMGSNEAIRALERLGTHRARRVSAGGSIEEVEHDVLQPGDIVEVVAGARIPSDGVVVQGASSVDNAALTGESLPVAVAPGAPVFGGALNVSGMLRVEITRNAEQSTLGRIVALMQQAEQAKPPITQWLERHIGVYLAAVLMLALLVWFISADGAAMLAVIVAACPCALVLAMPSTAIAGIALGARHGVLFKDATFLYKMNGLDSLIIDKTGTLTFGALSVASVDFQPGVDAEAALSLAGQLGAASAHPVSVALRTYARDVLGQTQRALPESTEIGGFGVVATSPAGVAVLGRDALLRDHGVTLPGMCVDGAMTRVSLALNGQMLAQFMLTDQCRPEAAEALAALRELGLTEQIMLTGDRADVAHAVAAEVGITDVRANSLPADKLSVVVQLSRAGRRPLVVGDGVNDALALKAGATGIALGGRGIDIAAACADIVLMQGDLRAIGIALRIGQMCRNTAWCNAVLGIAWTVFVLVLAGTGMIGPVSAAVLHNVGTFAVLANAGRLLRFDARPELLPDSERGVNAAKIISSDS